MEVLFNDDRLADLFSNPKATSGVSQAIDRAFRNRIQFILSAKDERDFYAMRGLRFEKLKGARKHQRSMRLNDQWRLIIEFEGEGESKKVIIISIEDYH